MENEYMWGGEGQDVIHSGDSVENSFINGNSGDDIIHPGDNNSVSE